MNGQRGLTLTELIIGLALASIVGLGLTQLFVANSKTHRTVVAQSAIQETGRFALDHLVRAVQVSGYKGCYSRGAPVFRTFIGAPPYEFDLTRGLIGYEGNSASWTPDIDAVLPRTVGGVDTNVYSAGATGPGNGIDTSAILRGTDIFTTNFVRPPGHRLAAALPTSSEPVEVESADFDFGADHIAFIHDCEKSTLFRVTGIAADDKIEHDGTVDPDGYTNAMLRLAEFNTFETDAYVSAVESHTYFIAESESANSQGDRPLALWRKSGVEAPIEIVEGVEDLQLRYGLDTDGDAVPNRYVGADSVLDFADVLTVRVTIVANSVDPVGGSSTPTHGCLAGGGRQQCLAGETYDGLVRRAFSQTVRLKNGG